MTTLTINASQYADIFFLHSSIHHWCKERGMPVPSWSSMPSPLVANSGPIMFTATFRSQTEAVEFKLTWL